MSERNFQRIFEAMSEVEVRVRGAELDSNEFNDVVGKWKDIEFLLNIAFRPDDESVIEKLRLDRLRLR